MRGGIRGTRLRDLSFQPHRGQHAVLRQGDYSDPGLDVYPAPPRRAQVGAPGVSGRVVRATQRLGNRAAATRPGGLVKQGREKFLEATTAANVGLHERHGFRAFPLLDNPEHPLQPHFGPDGATIVTPMIKAAPVAFFVVPAMGPLVAGSDMTYAPSRCCASTRPMSSVL